MEDGFVKVYREIREWALYEDSKCVHLLIHLMVSVNHKPNKFFFGGELVEVKEGQLITGRKKLSAETGIHESSIERILDKLEKVGEIEQQTNRDNRLITMKKWNKFQTKRTTTEQEANNDRTTTEQRPNTNKNDKNEKKVKNEENKSVQSPLEVALENFYDMRKKKKNPITEYGKELLIKDLKRLSSDEQTQIKIIEQSILRGWAGVFELKEQQNTTPSNVEVTKRLKDFYADDDYSEKAHEWRAIQKYKLEQQGVNNENAKKLSGLCSSVGRV